MSRRGIALSRSRSRNNTTGNNAIHDNATRQKAKATGGADDNFTMTAEVDTATTPRPTNAYTPRGRAGWEPGTGGGPEKDRSAVAPEPRTVTRAKRATRPFALPANVPADARSLAP